METKKLIAIALVLTMAAIPLTFAEDADGFTVVKAEKAYYSDNMFVLEFGEGLTGSFTYAVTDPDENSVAGPMTVQLSGQTEVNILPNEDADIVPGKYQVKLVSVNQVVSEVVEVPLLAQRIDLNYSSLSMTAGDQIQITATVYPSDVTDKSVVWSSSDESVAKVSQDGNVTAYKAGTAEITVKSADGAATAVCKVTVDASPEPVPEDDGDEGGSSSTVLVVVLIVVAVMAIAGAVFLLRSRKNQ